MTDFAKSFLLPSTQPSLHATKSTLRMSPSVKASMSSPSVKASMSSPSIKASILDTMSTSSDGWSTMQIITVALIIVVLALLGLNIFTYMAKGTDMIGEFLQKVSKNIPIISKDVLSTTITGTEMGADIAAGMVKDTGDILDRELNLKRDKLWKTRDTGIIDAIEKRHIPGINRFLTHEPKSNKESPYEEDKDSGDIQKQKKPAYCYIGTDRSFRSCIKVDHKDDCESGKIFPTMQLCINPSLRK